MAHLLPLPKIRFFDANGAPLAGGKLFSYAAGTSTLQATYTDQTESVANSNPVVLDANGEASVWIGANAYKFVLKDSSDNVIWTTDGVSHLNSGSVTTVKLADGSVTLQKLSLVDGTFPGAKIVNESITTGKLADGVLSADVEGLTKMADGFVTNAKMAANSVGTTNLINGAVTSAKLAAGATQLKTAEFTATTTWVVPSGVASIFVSGIGGGGGGGSGATISTYLYGGGGGGSGGLLAGALAVTPGETLTITVGAGGLAGNPGGVSSVAGLAGSVAASGGRQGDNANSAATPMNGYGGRGASNGGNAFYVTAGNSMGGFGAYGLKGSTGGAGGFGVDGGSGAANTGAGGGGGSGAGKVGGSGGSGLVLITYVDKQ